MIDAKKIEEIIGSFTEGTDLFPVEVKISPANEVEVVIDSDTGVTIDQCVALSRAIEEGFDREAEDFELSVLSAGIGQPLKLPRQYQNTLGKPVEVVLKNGMKYAGTLEAVDEKSLTLSYEEMQLPEGKKRKVRVEVRREFPLDEIKSTVRQILFR
ncbi:MAG: ribosome assembly cofactor RimP [Rikenellaceae bacterium]|jgi:ribosome maturation factor RimP|nr:ribosome assembly cofactor RimP [Rikenellaceae bacterium]